MSLSVSVNLPLKSYMMCTWEAQKHPASEQYLRQQLKLLEFNVLNCNLIITPLSKDAQIPATDLSPRLKRIIHINVPG